MTAGEEAMPGGVDGAVRVGDEVRRTPGPWTPTVQRLLDHLRSRGLDWVPEPRGLDELGRDRVSFLPGEVPRYPLPDWVWHDDVLTDAGRMLAELHRAADGFDSTGAVWRTPVHEPVEVLCHNDFAPTNLVFVGGRPAGVIDWDTASPGPRVWDVAYLAYRLVPLTDPANPDGLAGPIDERARRLGLLCETYGHGLRPADVLPVTATRLDDLARYTAGRAAEGHAQLLDHVRLYRHDARWVRAHVAGLGG